MRKARKIRVLGLYEVGFRPRTAHPFFSAEEQKELAAAGAALRQEFEKYIEPIARVVNSFLLKITRLFQKPPPNIPSGTADNPR